MIAFAEDSWHFERISSRSRKLIAVARLIHGAERKICKPKILERDTRTPNDPSIEPAPGRGCVEESRICCVLVPASKVIEVISDEHNSAYGQSFTGKSSLSGKEIEINMFSGRLDLRYRVLGREVPSDGIERR
jgi:hypothetical protein